MTPYNREVEAPKGRSRPHLISKISERVRAGLQRARNAGKVLGRLATAPIKRNQVLALKQDNPKFSVRKLAEAVNLSPSMVHKILKQSV